MGIDRVVQLMTGATHIREVLAFPVMRPMSSPNITTPINNTTHNKE